jgi:hypothetical protein
MLEIQQSTCAPYYEVRMAASGRKQIVIRKYPKLISTIGEIGGNREIIYLGLFLLYKFLRDYKFKWYKIAQASRITNRQEIERYLGPECTSDHG